METNQQSDSESSSDDNDDDSDQRARGPDAARAPGRLLTPAFMALVLPTVASGMSLSVFLLVPKFLTTELHAGPWLLSVVTAAFGLSGVVAVPLLAGPLARAERRHALMLANGILAAGAFGYARIEEAGWAAAALRGLHGLAITVSLNAATTLAADLAPPARMTQALALITGATLLTNALAPWLAEALIPIVGYRLVFAGAGLIALGAVVAAVRVREPRRAAPAGPSSPLAPLIARSSVRRVLMAVAISGAGCGVMMTFSQPLALARGVEVVRAFFVSYAAGALLVRVGMGNLLDRWGARRACQIGFVLYGLSLLAMCAVAPGRLGLLGFLFGLAQGIVYPALIAFGMQAVAPSERRSITALVHGAFAAGTVSVVLLGAAAERVGYPAVFAASAIASWGAMRLVKRPPPNALREDDRPARPRTTPAQSLAPQRLQ